MHKKDHNNKLGVHFGPLNFEMKKMKYYPKGKIVVPDRGLGGYGVAGLDPPTKRFGEQLNEPNINSKFIL